MSDLRDRIERVIENHTLINGADECTCGVMWEVQDGFRSTDGSTCYDNHLADAVIAALPELTPESAWRASMNETRPDYILAIRAQALDKVQELIEPYENDAAPHPEAWARIVEAAFPPPPIAGGDG